MSESGVQANVIIAVSGDDEAGFAQSLREQFGDELRVVYRGPMIEGGEVIRTP